MTATVEVYDRQIERLQRLLRETKRKRKTVKMRAVMQSYYADPGFQARRQAKMDAAKADRRRRAQRSVNASRGLKKMWLTDPRRLPDMTADQRRAYNKFRRFLSREEALSRVLNSSGSAPPPPVRTAATRVSASARPGGPPTLPPAGREI